MGLPRAPEGVKTALVTVGYYLLISMHYKSKKDGIKTN